MSETTIGLVGLVAMALVVDYTNGFRDSAHSIATVVATRVLRPRFAVAWAALFNFVAFVFVGTAVANTVGQAVKSTISAWPWCSCGQRQPIDHSGLADLRPGRPGLAGALPVAAAVTAAVYRLTVLPSHAVSGVVMGAIVVALVALITVAVRRAPKTADVAAEVDTVDAETGEVEIRCAPASVRWSAAAPCRPAGTWPSPRPATATKSAPHTALGRSRCRPEIAGGSTFLWGYPARRAER
jgi:hypothetical protein